MRTCVGTRTQHPKRDMIRIVCTDDGHIVVDETGKRSGSRGAYVSKSLAAAQAAVRDRRLEAEFGRALDPGDAERILAFFERFG